MRRTLLILLPLLTVAAGALYLTLDAATATFFLFAGLTVSGCAASTTLLGAYTRRKAILRQQEEEQARTIDRTDLSN